MTTCVAGSATIALLGCGNVGTAFARLAARDLPGRGSFNIIGALVRDAVRPRRLETVAHFTTDPRALFAGSPDVVVELLGGREPARSLVLEALERRIAVVTANKTLLAHHGAELRAAAGTTGTPMLYEAAVLAGVPFLGTLARRPYAAAASRLTGIANGTSNFILSRCAGGGDFGEALREAQRLGYAEPDPHSDLCGADAAEKLAVLLQHFCGRNIHPGSIETSGIDRVSSVQTVHARELGGVIKPVIAADWTEGVTAFAGPAFVPAAHPLSAVDGCENALLLGSVHGRLLFQGPGAGPDVTAATVLDDVREVAEGLAPPSGGELKSGSAGGPDTEWMVTLDAVRLPRAVDVADLLASHQVYSHRVSRRLTVGGREFQSLLTWPASRPPLERALAALGRAADCSTDALRALEVLP